MRLTARMIASTFAAFAIQSVNADPVSAPSTAAPAPAASAPAAPVAPTTQAPAARVTSAPAGAAPASAASAANPEFDSKEKALIAEGYRVQVRNGTRVFCKHEQVLGSRLGGVESCGTVEEVMTREQMSRQLTQHAQQYQTNPKGN